MARPEVDAGTLIREARHEDGLSLVDLGERIGISFAFLSDVERGVRLIGFRHWRSLFEALPSLDAASFAIAFLKSGSIRLDLSSLSDADRVAVGKILARAAMRSPKAAA